MKNLKKLLMIALFAIPTLQSCKKDDETTDTFTQDQIVALDQNQLDTETEDVTNLIDQAMYQNQSVINGRISTDTIQTLLDSTNCAQVTIIPKGTNPTGKITIDFGTGCLCKDGRMRKGKIISQFNNPIRKQGSLIETTFENYGVTKRNSTEYINVDNSSTKSTQTTQAPDSLVNGSVVDITRVLNMKMILGTGQTFTYTGTKLISFNLGQLQNSWDNVITTKTGSSLNGVDRNGGNYTLTVNSNVVRKLECFLIGVYKPVSGEVTIQNDSKTKVINYGDGSCDNSVDVSINGKKTRTRW